MKSKLNGYAKLAGVVLAFVLAAGTGVYTYGQLSGRVTQNKTDIEALKDVPVKLSAIEAKVDILLERRP